jgi:hypothetical protein
MGTFSNWDWLLIPSAKGAWKKTNQPHTHPVWLWGRSPCKISSPGPIFHGTKWLLWRPHMQSPTLHSRCSINKGLIKKGSTIDRWRSRCKGWILWPNPYTYIHMGCYLFWELLPSFTWKGIRKPRKNLSQDTDFNRGTSPNSRQQRQVFDLGVRPFMVFAVTKKRWFSIRGIKNPSLEN